MLSIMSTDAVVGKLMIFCIHCKKTSVTYCTNSTAIRLTHIQIGHIRHTLIDGLQYFVGCLGQKGKLTGACIGNHG